MARNMLMFVSRVADLPYDKIPKGLKKARVTGRCEFCNEPVMFNKYNMAEQVGKGYDVHLICTFCYGQGNHIKQGYTP